MSYTYIMKNHLGMVRIGQSPNPDKLLLTVVKESGTPISLEHKVEGAYLTKHVHMALEQYHMNDEWFNCSVEQAIKTLNELKLTVKVNILIYNKEQLESLHRKRLNQLINVASSYHYLARMLGLPSSTAQGWVTRGRISKAGAKLVGKHPTLKKKFTALYLRPDL